MHSYKPARRVLPGVLVALLAAVLAVVAYSGAVTGTGTFAERHVAVTDLGDGDYGVDIVNDNRSSLVELGDYQLAESAINTKTFTSDGQGCGNVSMSYNRANTTTTTYTLEKLSQWNHPDSTCGSGTGGVRGSLTGTRLRTNTGVYRFHGTLLDGETDAWFPLTTGTATSRACWDYQDMTPGAGSHNAIGQVIPGGGGGWTKDPGFSC